MEAPKPLNFETAKLISTLEERLSALQKKRTDKENAAKAKSAKAKDSIVAILNEVPEVVVLVNLWLREEFGVSATHSKFAETVKEAYEDEDENIDDLDQEILLPHDEKALTRLIAVYKLTSDDTVELQVHDEAYRYLA